MRKTNLTSNDMQLRQTGKRTKPGLKNYVLLIGVAIIISFLSAACASQQADFPTGKFDLAQKQITFLPDGTFTVWVLNTETFDVEEGRYSVDGNQITLQDEECAGDGTYTWEFDERYLVFDPIEDACEGRLESLSRGKWLFKP